MSADSSDRVTPRARSRVTTPVPGPREPWLRTPIGLVVGLLWLGMLLGALSLVRTRPALVAIEVLTALFGLYASSVALRKDRTAGVVILVALAFSFALLNWALYMALSWPRPLAR